MRVLVISHVDARWIKQRPHFLAEALSGLGHKVIFAYARAYSRSLLGSDRVNLRSLPLIMVPQRLQRKLRILDFVVQVIWGSLLAPTRADVVVVTSPRMMRIGIILRRLTGAVLIYDHMDRTTEFGDRSSVSHSAETQAMTAADLVLCSSSVLRSDVEARRRDDKALLVRNALARPEVWAVGSARPSEGTDELILGYAGTISSWFDWPVVLAALEKNPGWVLRLWGPADSSIPSDAQVIQMGVIPHSALPSALGTCDVLVMPFVVTPLIDAVDPVKAYEYIATGRGVVLPRYASSEPFASHVEFYARSDPRDFQRAVRAAASRGDNETARTFAYENTWAVRAAQIVDFLREA